MFGFSQVKLIALGLAIITITGIITAGYFHYTGLVEDNARLRENSTKLELALTQERAAVQAAVAAVGEWKGAMDQLASRVEDLSRVSDAAASESRRLNQLFAEHDFRALAAGKPGLIERRVNDGTRRVFGVLERETAGGSQRSAPAGQAGGKAAGP